MTMLDIFWLPIGVTLKIVEKLLFVLVWLAYNVYFHSTQCLATSVSKYVTRCIVSPFRYFHCSLVHVRLCWSWFTVRN